jgi:hypothetical protein
VIDIKPPSPRHEYLAQVRLPAWYDRLWPGKKT